MYRSGLLLLTSPLRSLIEAIGNNLLLASRTVQDRLYVSLEPGRTTLWPPHHRSSGHDLGSISRLIPAIYVRASSICRTLDIRVVLSPHKASSSPTKTNLDVDVILTDSGDADPDVARYVHHQFRQPCFSVVRLESFDPRSISGGGAEEPARNGPADFATYDTVVIGGTFDRLHNGHKVLLSCSVLRARKKLIVGVTDGDMLARKTLSELIEPVEKRIEAVKEFLQDIDLSLEYYIVPIYDAFGPSIVYSEIDCIVVSEETKRGGDLVNIEREARNMKKLDVVMINLLEEPYLEAGDEAKISSSNQRRALLGSYLKRPEARRNRHAPLRIALTGELQNVKSLICKDMEELGTSVIDCDELVQSLLTSKPALSSGLLNDVGEEFNGLNCVGGLTKKFNLIMLKEKNRWEKVNALLLPEIKSAVERKIEEIGKEDISHIILKMPSFADDAWLSDADQVWGTMALNSEYEKYLRTHYSLSDDEIKDIIKCKLSNAEIIKQSHVVFCHQGDDDILRKQVRKAWDQLQDLSKEEMKSH